MIPLKNWDIRARVLLVAMVPTLVLAILLTVILTSSRLADIEESAIQRGSSLTKQLAAAAEYGLIAGNREALSQLSTAARINPDLRAIAIYDLDGVRLAFAGDLADEPLVHNAASGVTRLPQKRLLRIAEAVQYTPTENEDPYTLSGGQPSQPRNIGQIVVVISLEALDGRKNAQIIAALITLLSVLAGSAALGIFMSKTVSAPIWRIARAVREIGNGALSTRVSVNAEGSLRVLAEGVNEMAARLAVSREELQARITAATAALRERTEEAERANLAKSRFLAAASHDLRQPMHALGLFIAELEGQALDAGTTQLVERIAASSSALENLLDSLLDISRLDAGVVTPDITKIELGPLFERLAHDYAASAAEKGLRLRVRPTSACVSSDPVLLERILINLLGNAIRYTQHGSIMLAARRRNGRLRIEVRDSGPGIPQHAQATIFQEFVQLENAARDRSKGLGLGLAIVRRLADLLCHPLMLQSTLGRGSVFAIELPLAQAKAAPLSITSRPDDDLAGAVIAIIDDDMLARQSLAGLLKAWGCVVIAGESLADLLDALARSPRRADLLISDFRLPGAHDGFDVIAHLRASYNRQLPAILISGDTGPDTLRRASDYGIPILSKPVRASRLRAMLAELYRESRT